MLSLLKRVIPHSKEIVPGLLSIRACLTKEGPKLLSSHTCSQNFTKNHLNLAPVIPNSINQPVLPILPRVSINDPLTKLKIDSPLTWDRPIITYGDITSKVEIADPSKVIEKKAARLIVIRRRKMKRHQLKKLRIKMRFEWGKIRQKREMKKEKEFQATLMAQIKKAEMFSAERYVSEKLQKSNEVLIPKLWKGKRLPEFVIRELIEEKKQKEKFRMESLERRKKMNLDVSSYKV